MRPANQKDCGHLSLSLSLSLSHRPWRLPNATPAAKKRGGRLYLALTPSKPRFTETKKFDLLQMGHGPLPLPDGFDV